MSSHSMSIIASPMAMIPSFPISIDNHSVPDVLISIVGSYTLDALLDVEQRRQHKELCAERLAAQDNIEVQYAEQAVLANLDWGIDALEEAIGTSNEETKNARLQYAEKMLQVSALLDISRTTAGVPNSYLSAWALLNLAFVWKLRNDDKKAAVHMLEMFLVDSFYSRIDFAPDLWEHLFLPHLTSIVAWYTEQRHQILSSALLDGSDLSLSKEDLSYNPAEYKNLLSTVSPEQALKLQQLEQLYQDSLDENTRLYARYYKDWLNFDPIVSTKRSMPLMPIAEPPMTPMHELSFMPESIKFGPQPLASAGFSHNNFGMGIAFVNDNQPATMFMEENSSQEGPYRMPQGRQNQIWEEHNVPEERPHGVEGNGYSLDSPNIGNHSSLRKHSSCLSDSSIRQQLPKGDVNNANVQSSQERSPKDKSSPPSTARTSIMESSKLRRHDRASKVRPGKSKPLLSLFQDSDAIMLSSPQSMAMSLEEPCSSAESELKVEESLQQREKIYARTALVHQEASISSTPEYVESISEEEDHEFQKDDDEEKQEEESSAKELWKPENRFCPPLRQEDDSPSMVVAYAEDQGRNLSLLKLQDVSIAVTRPPKDFVCPITSQIFNDPVTLETGQTYERRAIQEWLDRGNTTCPITRQTLQSIYLPKTNYVLKRVIASWKEQHPELALEFGSSDNSPCLPNAPEQSYSRSSAVFDQTMPEAAGASPDSVIGSVCSENSNNTKGKRFNNKTSSHFPKYVINEDFLQGLISELKPAISCICTSDDLEECESAMLTIAHIWQESKGNQNIQLHLTREGVIQGFMEVLSTSNIMEIIAATLYILSELISRDESVGQIIRREESDYGCVVGLLKRGVMPAVVLLCLLRPSSSQLASSDLLLALLGVLRRYDNEDIPYEETFPMCMGPKEAACLMINQLLTTEEDSTKSLYARSIISMEGLSPLVDSLEGVSLEERISAVSILLCCMQADGSCRNYIAHRALLPPVLDLLHSGNERARIVTISFLSELVRLNRRSINNQLLQVIKEEGTLSTMHVLLVQLQMVPLEERPIVAGLLLQLDLLVRPRKGSMFREEAIEALIGALANEDIFISQVTAVETIVLLGGHFSYSGVPLTKLLLLKSVGLDQGYNAIMRTEHRLEGTLPVNLEEEEKEDKEWEKRVAGALINFENGVIFDALGRGMKSKIVELSSPCTVAVTWLVHMLTQLPDTGVQQRAHKNVIAEYIQTLKFYKDIEDAGLAVLALHGFLETSEGMQELVRCARDICGPLRQLKRSLPMANDILKKLINSPIVNSPEFWAHEDIGSPIDASANGEVRCLEQSQGRLFSGHSDGSMKVWDCTKKNLTLIQHVKEHLKSVTCLSIASLGDKLYSGSLDKTIRVWLIGPEQIHCIKCLDTRELVQSLIVNSATLCFAPQGAGVRVLEGETGAFKALTIGNKHVQSLAIADGKLFCGCTDNSIQEVDLTGATQFTIQQGVRTLLGKKAIYRLQVFDNKLYSIGSIVDGVAARVWSLRDRSVVGQLATSSDIRALAVNDEFIYLGSSSGSIEVWLRERFVKVAGMNVNSKVYTLLVYNNVMYCGSEDGKIRGWAIR